MVLKRTARRETGEYGLTMVEMIMVMLLIVIVASIVAPATLKMTSSSRLRSGGWTVYSFLRNARNTAIDEGVTVHVRYFNSSIGPALESYRLDSAQGNARFISPDWTLENPAYPKNAKIGSAILNESLRWSSAAGFLFFRPDGSTQNTATLRLERSIDNEKYAETIVYAGSGLMETNVVYDD